MIVATLIEDAWLARQLSESRFAAQVMQSGFYLGIFVWGEAQASIDTGGGGGGGAENFKL